MVGRRAGFAWLRGGDPDRPGGYRIGQKREAFAAGRRGWRETPRFVRSSSEA
jgi:hypothetical protein